jgi:hypothetical protein
MLGIWSVNVMFITETQLMIVSAMSGMVSDVTVVGFTIVNFTYCLDVVATLLLYRRLSWQLRRWSTTDLASTRPWQTSRVLAGTLCHDWLPEIPAWMGDWESRK